METNNDMTPAGVGPRLVITTLPVVALASIIMYKDPSFLVMESLGSPTATIVGSAWMALGLVFFILSAITFARGFKKGQLVTYGPFALCRNPIYASFIVFLVPALAIILKSGLILAVDIALYVNFKVLIREENINLKRIFGQEYEQYAKSVNEVIPIPKFWRR
ncbi:MAG: methyltransferase [Smithellaceae bacterium]|nr:methyltransferase [Smithellaceae bacterium]